MAARTTPADPDADKELSDPKAKFTIGFLAGLTALLAPLLTPVVSRGDLSAFQSVFGSGAGYGLLIAVLGVVWCMLIATVTMFIEWKEPKKPGETFFKALGIPAVLAGAIAATGQSFDAQATAERLNQALSASQTELSKTRTEFLEAKDIPVGKVSLPGDLLKSLSPPAPAPGAPPQGALPRPAAGHSSVASLARWLPSMTAHAAEPAPPPAVRAPASRPRYVVSVLTTTEKEVADAKRKELLDKLPAAVVVKSGDVYFLLTGTQPLSEKEAFDLALRLKEQGLQTQLITVQ